MSPRPGSARRPRRAQHREREMVMRVHEPRQDGRPPTSISPASCGAAARAASSPPTAAIRSPTIATPPLNGGSPGRAVNTRPLSRTSPRIVIIFARVRCDSRPLFPPRLRSTMQGPDEGGSPGTVAAVSRGGRRRRFEHASFDNDRRVPRDHRDHRRLHNRWRRGDPAHLPRHRPHLPRPGRISRSERSGGQRLGERAGDSAACNPPRQEGVTLTFVSFGGVYQEAQRKAWLEPYTELTGVQFTEDENSSNATIKAQVEVRPGDVGRRRRRQRLRPRGELRPARAARLLADPAGRGRTRTSASATAASRTSPTASSSPTTPRRPAARSPTGWADYFDTTKFPGKRGAWDYSDGRDARVRAHGRRRRARGPLSARPPASDEKLDTIKDDIVFWTSGAESQELIGSGEVAMTMIWNGRGWSAKNIDNKPVEIQWNQQIVTADYFVVPKGSPNKDAAMKFIAYTTCADEQRASRPSTSRTARRTSTPRPTRRWSPTSSVTNADENSAYFDDEYLVNNFDADRRGMAGLEGVADRADRHAAASMRPPASARRTTWPSLAGGPPRPLGAAGRSRRSSSWPCSSSCRSSTMVIRSVTDPPGAGLSNYERFFARGGVPPRPPQHVLDRRPVDDGLPGDRLPVRVPDDDRARPDGRPPADRGAAAVLVEPARPDVRLAGHLARHRGHQPVPARPRADQRAADPDPDDGRRDRRHVPHPAAVHGPADLRGDAPDRPGVRPGGGEPRRVAARGVPPGLRPAQPARASWRAACWCSSWRSASTSRRRCSVACATR